MRHGVVPTPFAPHKTRDGEVVLRRGSSCPQTGPAARRLTWTDARDVAGRLEHVQIFDTADAMAQCAGIAPESARFAPDYSPVRRDDAVPLTRRGARRGACFRDARAASPPPRDAAVRGRAGRRSPPRRLAAQLVRHEAEHGATAALDATARQGCPPTRHARAAAVVEGAAAATRPATPAAPGEALLLGSASTATWPPRGRGPVETTAALRLRRSWARSGEPPRRGTSAPLRARPAARAATRACRHEALHRDALALIDARASPR